MTAPGEHRYLVRSAMAVGLLLGMGCVPLTHAQLRPDTSLRQAEAQALRTSPELWTIELSLPNPGGVVPWDVVPEGGPPVRRRTQGGRAVFAWDIPAARWLDKRPLQVQVRTSGFDELVRLPHPTFEKAPPDALIYALQVIRPIPRL